jgi:tetratricopeptide (TPR) repeat protein
MLVDVPRRCPPAEVLAAFVEAKLDRPKVIELTSHLANCAECRLVVESVAELEAEEAVSEEQPASRSRWWMGIAAAAVIALVLFPFGRTYVHDWKRGQAMHELIDSASRTDRPIAPRLSGFAYSPKAPNYRGPGDEQEVAPEKLIVEGRAEGVRELSENDRSAAALHDHGVASLMLGETDAAVADLTRATGAAPDNATYWSDLSAALYAASHGNDHALLQRAADAAEHAIKLDPKLTAAYFNRAWALASLHPQRAVAVWQEYLQHDAASPWAAEARNEITNLTER